MQEGKGFNGVGFSRGFHGANIFNDILAAGGGYRKFYSKIDAFVLRTVAYTTARVWSFLYFYDWINPDARRYARIDFYVYAGYAGGMMGGILSNPFEIVFKRMQVDEMYPPHARRNYSSFLDGFVRCAQEGALFRGAMANGLKLGGLVSAAGGCYDWIKENMFFFFGPISLNRVVGTSVGVGVATALSMPFDAVATRLQTMRPLPNGQLPYTGTFDCLGKMLYHECNVNKYANLASLYSGGQAYAIRLWVIAMGSQYILDWYHHSARVTEFWQPARYHHSAGIDIDIHNPYTDGFNNMLVHNWLGKGQYPGFSPDGETNMAVV